MLAVYAALTITFSECIAHYVADGRDLGLPKEVAIKNLNECLDNSTEEGSKEDQDLVRCINKTKSPCGLWQEQE